MTVETTIQGLLSQLEDPGLTPSQISAIEKKIEILQSQQS